MELTKFMTVCSVFMFCCDFVYGTKQELEPVIRSRRGREPTNAPIKVTTPLPVTNVNQQDAIALTNNLNVKVSKIEPLNPTKGVIVGPVIKKIGSIVTTPALILYTTRRPTSKKPMVIYKNNNEIVTKGPKVEIKANENNDVNSRQTNNDINHDIITKAVQPNADSKNALQTICLEEHTQNKLDDVHEDLIGMAGKEKKEESQLITYHISDKNGKKITEITTTKIIEENSNNAASKHQSNEKCDTIELTDEHSAKEHLSEEKVKDKHVIAINKPLNETGVSKNLELKRNVEPLTTYHEISSDSRNLNTHLLDENHDHIKQDISHDIDCDAKNQRTHVLEAKLVDTKPLDKKITDEVKECNITQLEKKHKETQLPQAHDDHVDIKDNHPNITIKLVVDTPKVDFIKLINVSSVDLKPLKNVTMKPTTSDLVTNSVKDVPKVIIPNVNALLIANPLKPKVIMTPTRIFEIVNTTDCNTTKTTSNNKPKDLDIQRMKMSIRIETNSENKTAPIDCKNTLTASVLQHENGVNGTYTKVDIKLDDEKNDTKETITIHRNKVEEIVDRYKYPFTNNLYDNSPYNTNENNAANNNYLMNFDNSETVSTARSVNNIVTDCSNYIVNGNYVPENYVKYNNYDKYQQVNNPNDNIQGNLNLEQNPNNCFSNNINGQYYLTYRNVIPPASYNQNYQNIFQTDNSYLNPNAYYSQNFKPNTNRAFSSYYNIYNPWKYNYVNNVNCNRNNPAKLYNYKERYVPGRYHDRIWRTWNNMDITVSNKGAPLRIEFGKDDKNTIHLYSIKNNSNPYIIHKQLERPCKERLDKLNLSL